jgi:hypothetical protein
MKSNTVIEHDPEAGCGRSEANRHPCPAVDWNYGMPMCRVTGESCFSDRAVVDLTEAFPAAPDSCPLRRGIVEVRRKQR